MPSSPVYIVDEIGAIVSATDAVTFAAIGKHINYMYGHYLEIISRLQQMTSSPDVADRSSKFPLIALFQDFPEERDRSAGVYASVSLNMIIAMDTLPEYISSQRYGITFKPILYPIYTEFLNQIANPKRKNVFIEDCELISHTKIDRVFFGKEGMYGGSANMFNDYLDCIEIKNLRLSFYNTY